MALAAAAPVIGHRPGEPVERGPSTFDGWPVDLRPARPRVRPLRLPRFAGQEAGLLDFLGLVRLAEQPGVHDQPGLAQQLGDTVQCGQGDVALGPEVLRRGPTSAKALVIVGESSTRLIGLRSSRKRQQ